MGSVHSSTDSLVKNRRWLVDAILTVLIAFSVLWSHGDGNVARSEDFHARTTIDRLQGMKLHLLSFAVNPTAAPVSHVHD